MELDGIKSQNQTILCGILQGSTLGLLLFLINDLPNSSEKLSFKIFADDTNVFASAKDRLLSLPSLESGFHMIAAIAALFFLSDCSGHGDRSNHMGTRR